MLDQMFMIVDKDLKPIRIFDTGINSGQMVAHITIPVVVPATS